MWEWENPAETGPRRAESPATHLYDFHLHHVSEGRLVNAVMLRGLLLNACMRVLATPRLQVFIVLSGENVKIYMYPDVRVEGQ